jgi:hypothetical protein
MGPIQVSEAATEAASLNEVLGEGFNYTNSFSTRPVIGIS